MGDEQDKIAPTNYVIESIKAEIEQATLSKSAGIVNSLLYERVEAQWVKIGFLFVVSNFENVLPAGMTADCDKVHNEPAVPQRLPQPAGIHFTDAFIQEN